MINPKKQHLGGQYDKPGQGQKTPGTGRTDQKPGQKKDQEGGHGGQNR